MSLNPQAVDYDDTWPELRKTVWRVVRGERVDRGEWVRAFSLVYVLCTALPDSFSARLYFDFRNLVAEHLCGLYRRVLYDECEDYSDRDLFVRYESAWTEFRQVVSNLQHMFIHFDQIELKKEEIDGPIEASAQCDEHASGERARPLSVGDTCRGVWERCVLLPLAPRLTRGLTSALDGLRTEPSTIDPDFEKTLRVFIDSTIEVRMDRDGPYELYEKVVLEPYLETVGASDAPLASDMIIAGDIALYLKSTHASLAREMSLVDRLLHASSRDVVRARYERSVISPHLSELLTYAERRLGTPLADALPDVRLVYALVRSFGAKSSAPLVEAFRTKMEREGVDLLYDPPESTDPSTHFVESVVALRTKYENFVREAFDSDRAFLAAVDRACKVCVNARPKGEARSPAPDLLARYCDSLLRRRRAPEVDVSAELAAVPVLYGYLDDKDYFQSFYAKAFAKRLIYGISASMELEEATIDRLKEVCQYDFVNRLRRMFTDIALAADLNVAFRNFLQNEGRASDADEPKFNVRVLQAGAWPLSGEHARDGERSTPFDRLLHSFEKFYHASFSGRRLTWLQYLCGGELRTRYTSRPHCIDATAVQCALLLEFNSTDVRDAEEVRQTLGLSVDMWQRALQPILDADLLISENDNTHPVIRLNLAFTSKRSKLRLKYASPQTDKPPDKSKCRVDCEQDRRLFLQAVIVRIMKKRKVCAHGDLLQEVTAAARDTFSPTVTLVKTCIESLIEKQYLERSTAHPDTYHYLA